MTERRPHRHPHGQAQGRATHGEEEDAALKDENRGGKDTTQEEEEEERHGGDSSPSDPVNSPGIRRAPRAGV